VEEELQKPLDVNFIYPISDGKLDFSISSFPQKEWKMADMR